MPTRLVGVQVIAVAAGYEHNLVLLADGTIDGWGEPALPDPNPTPCNMPPGGPPPFSAANERYVAIAAGEHISVAIRTDGTLTAWGECYSPGCGDYSCNPCRTGTPPGPWSFLSAIPSGNDFIAIGCTGHYAIAQRSNGTLVAWGVDGHCQVTDLFTGVVTAFAAGHQHGLTLTASTFAYTGWGNNGYGQRDNTPWVPTTQFPCPGSCIAFGCSPCYKPPPVPFPTLFRVGGGYNHSVGQLPNLSLIGWGRNSFGQSDVPAGNFYAFSSNYDHGFAILDVDSDDSYLNFDGGSSSSVATRFTASDVATFHQEWVAGQPRTDVDGNGVVNGTDYLRFVDLYSRTVGGAP
ncbi:MAG: hypothetical protein ACKVW3_15795 [Phycisphaerales bacterium]